MICALLLAALHSTPGPRTAPVDTGWHQATIDREPIIPPTFTWRHVPAPAGTTDVRLYLTMELDGWVEVENHDKVPHSFEGSLSLRNYQCYDRHGWAQFWFRETGQGFSVVALQPGETRYVHVTYSVGPIMEQETNVAAWSSAIKYGQFDTYRPVVYSIDGHLVNPDDYSIPKAHGLEVYTADGYSPSGHVTHPMGRLFGWVEFR